MNIILAVWRMRWLALAILFVFLGVTAAVTTALPRVYEATATLRVIPSQQDQDVFNQLQARQALARTYATLPQSPAVYENAVDRGELSISPGDLSSRTKISYVDGTELIRVTVEASSPEQARYQADIVAQAIVEDVEEQEYTGSERLVVASAPTLPGDPVRPSWRLNMTLALLLGIGSAIGTVLLIEFFSGRISSPEEVEELVEAPVLGLLPDLDKAVRKDNKTGNVQIAFEEAVRTLRINVSSALGGRLDNAAVLVTSAVAEEGKSTISIHLAEAYTRSGNKCLLVDADLRRPQLHRRLSLRNSRGLSDLLLKEPEAMPSLISKVDSKVENSPKLAVLTSGPIPPNAADLLSLAKTEGLVHSMKEQFGKVILVTPPGQVLADASILGKVVDGVILVVDASKANRRALLRTVDQLRASNARILGVVINRAAEEDAVSYFYTTHEDK